MCVCRFQQRSYNFETYSGKEVEREKRSCTKFYQRKPHYTEVNFLYAFLYGSRGTLACHYYNINEIT